MPCRVHLGIIGTSPESRAGRTLDRVEKPSHEDAASLEETNQILSDLALMEAIREAEADLDAGRTFTHAEVLDQFRRRRSDAGE